MAVISDGVSIGLGTFKQLPTIMIGSFVTTVIAMSQVANQGLGIVGVWACMNVFFISRIAGHLLLSKKLRIFFFKGTFQRNAQPAQDSTLPVAA